MSSENELAHQITDSQRRIYGYIHSLVGKSAASWDILQETNLVLWRKREEAGKVRNFEAWAFTIARFQVNPLFSALQSGPTAVSGVSRQNSSPGNSRNHEHNQIT